MPGPRSQRPAGGRTGREDERFPPRRGKRREWPTILQGGSVSGRRQSQLPTCRAALLKCVSDPTSSVGWPIRRDGGRIGRPMTHPADRIVLYAQIGPWCLWRSLRKLRGRLPLRRLPCPTVHLILLFPHIGL